MKKKTDKTNEDNFWKATKRFCTDERTTFALGLALFLLTLYLSMACISFFVTGDDDKSVIDSYPKRKEQVTLLKERTVDPAAIRQADKELVELRGSIRNWTGYQGAVIAEYLVNRTFGVAVFALLWFVLVVALRLMNVRFIPLWKAFLQTAFLAVWLSLLLDFCFGRFCADTHLIIGGAHGIWLDSFLTANIGFTGTLLLLVGTGLLFALFAFAATLPTLRNLFRKKEKLPESSVTADTDDPQSNPSDIDDEQQHTQIIDVEEKQWQITNDVPQISEKIEIEEQTVDDVDKPETENEGSSTDIETTDTTKNDDTVDAIDATVEVQGPYDPKADLDNYKYPTLDLLKPEEARVDIVSQEEKLANQQRIITTLQHYGIGIKKIIETIGPTITLYEIIPDDGVRINKIRNLEADIMLSLSAVGIRIIAPIPGKGTIGIEVPNQKPRAVSGRATIGSKKFQESTYDLPVAIGRTITNEVFMFDLCKMPHLLVAGATGQGKSVGLNAIIASLLYKKHPAELKFVLIDPKKVEFSIYNDIEKYFLAELPDAEEPVITDVDKVKQTLNALCKEMDTRYDLLKMAHVRNIKEYNEKFINRHLLPSKGHHYLPYIVVVIDEFGDLIMTAGKEIELPIARIAQLARAVGIHMIIATQRPSVNIITGMIKANFPARIAFRVSAQVDSKTILDASGAQQLIGRGDLLFSQGNDMTRVQCAFIDTPEIENIVKFISSQQGYPEPFLLPEPDMPESDSGDSGVDMNKLDALFSDAAHWVVQSQQGSTSMVQRKFQIGFNRAGRIMDQLEAAGIVGPVSGSKPRQVLVHTEYELEDILKTF